MTDSRWSWGRRYVTLRQDASATTPQKAGFVASDGWVAYHRDGHVFVKQFAYSPAARHPDLGCNVEVFTNNEMLELETLAPLVCLAPNASVEHLERWQLVRRYSFAQRDGYV